MVNSVFSMFIVFYEKIAIKYAIIIIKTENKNIIQSFIMYKEIANSFNFLEMLKFKSKNKLYVKINI